MNQFFKTLIAATLGVFVALFLMFMFFVVFLGSMADTKPQISKNTVLDLNLSAQIPEITGNVNTSGLDFEKVDLLGLNTITQLIDHAAKDKKVSGILIRNNSVGGGMATQTKIRESILNFKKSGKFVYSYADYYSQSAYYLGSSADSIFLNPLGMVDVKGFAAFIPFFKSALDKVGISMNIFYAGNFKSATEPYRRDEMSDENRIQTKEFLDSMMENFKNAISESRNLSLVEVDQIMTEYKGKSAKSSLESGLVDDLLYWDEIESIIKNRLGLEMKKKIKFKTLKEYNAAVTLRYGKSKSSDKIAVVYAEGTITYGTKNKGSISEDQYLEIFNKLQYDDDVKAVVLRVNSPGGNSLTSDIIWRGVENLKSAGKPVVASFGDYAASGGYYIAAGADSIVSAPNTLTGSIGVFMMFPNATNLANEKLGISFDEVKTHPMAVGFTPLKDLTDQEKEILQQGTLDTYDTFLNRVAEGRGMTVEEVHEVAQGRVWTGTKAKELGLVDVLGDIEDAIEIAAQMVNIEEYKIKSFPQIEESFIDQLVKGFAASENMNAKLGIHDSELKLIKEYREFKSLLLDRTPQARLPFIIQVD
ncbi:MAG: signal peptide peptidase SppA [Saprospiraceae bacterium]|nr:signal peptide peptidase SppA [Saprospiraceae bacterium]